LAAQSHSGLSFQKAEETCDVNGMGTLRLLEVLRNLPRPPKLFHASSSEIFGRPDSFPQDEQTPMRPVTPYGCSKAFATQLTTVYRNSHNLFAVNGILYNHESPRRGTAFVTQKICAAAAAIKEGRQRELRLGNTSARRDWGDAREYVRGMWLALQHPVPEDFVFATGVLHSVEDVMEAAFQAVHLDWREYVKHDQTLMRPDDPTTLVGDPGKAEGLLGWRNRTPFQALVAEMVTSHLRL
jgi:GDPmannose 4,6-dehydratase